METSLKIATAVVFCIGSALIIPKVADAITVLSSLATNSVRSIESNSQTLNTESSSDIYEPPNNGSPDSQHGTGTR
ncbi:hypothetical protein H6G81_01970 [Scytonema hofmannii FACHB-248]|uniref:Uncharacterized protein n=1 Tax=Scytonema hofmannii FACHB-248 TaxID=1842502 RepID=A0ABR8GJU4_9CYAN|nr:hypothetical protein [Scytonema hofmannii FACHB-248]